MKNLPLSVSKHLAVISLFVLSSALALPLRAEFPEKGQYAVGFAAGLSEPFASSYHAGWTFNGSFDYYVSNHIGLRGSAGYSHSSTDFGGAYWKGSFLASAVYPFGADSVHPFARAGIGLYLVSPPGEGNRARLGAHVGGGVEWFFKRRVSLTGEGLFHVLTNVVGRGASSFELTAGVRYYF
jgi:hypothetical protein